MKEESPILTNKHHKISLACNCRNIILQKHRHKSAKKICCRLVIVLAQTKQFRDKRIRKTAILQTGSSSVHFRKILNYSVMREYPVPKSTIESQFTIHIKSPLSLLSKLSGNCAINCGFQLQLACSQLQIQLQLG